MVSFILVLLFVTKNEISTTNVILERYGIIVTLIGIPLALRIFHKNMQKASSADKSTLNKTYKKNFYMRLAILSFIAIFDIVALYTTGSKNFIFMTIITIFAFFLSLPQKEVNSDNEIQTED